MSSIRVLVLNTNEKPRAIISIERAFTLLNEKSDGSGRVKIVLSALDVSEAEVPLQDRYWRSARALHPVPLVVQLTGSHEGDFDLTTMPMGRPTLPALVRRDNGRCMYCLRTAKELGRGNYWTMDHIVPKFTFENTCLACFECNNRKGGRTPEEAGMTLHGEPLEPNRWTILEQSLLRCQREYVRQRIGELQRVLVHAE